LYDGPSAKWSEPLGELAAGAKVIATGRDAGGAWLQLPWGWLEAAQFDSDGDREALPVREASRVILKALKRTFILSEPNLGAEFVAIFEAGEEALALERNGAGSWLKTAQGWVPRDAIQISGPIESLVNVDLKPVFISLRAGRMSPPVRERPSTSARKLRTIGRGVKTEATARTRANTWLYVGDGWVAKGNFDIEGDIMHLPFDAPAPRTPEPVYAPIPAEMAKVETAAIPQAPKEAAFVTISLKVGIEQRAVNRLPKFGSGIVGNIASGAKRKVTGRSAKGTWLYVGHGWVLSAAFDIEGDLKALPILSPGGKILAENTTARTVAMPASPAALAPAHRAPSERVDITLYEMGEVYELPSFTGYCVAQHDTFDGDYGGYTFEVFYSLADLSRFATAIYNKAGEKLAISDSYTLDDRIFVQEYLDKDISHGRLTAWIHEIDTGKSVSVDFELDAPGQHYLGIIC